jgi:diacylglycerol kinase (ATP)
LWLAWKWYPSGGFARLICSAHRLRPVDVGVLGTTVFLVGTTMGVSAQMMQLANRDRKDRLGYGAYLLSILQAIRNPQVIDYRLTIDGQTFERQGIECLISNAGNLGIPGFALSPVTTIDDGLLDVVIVHRADLAALLSVVARMTPLETPVEPVDHWQGQSIQIEATPRQTITADGDVVAETPVEIHVEHGALQVIVPG